MSGSLLPLSPTMSIGSTNNKWEEINLAGEIHTTKKSGTIIENLSNNADDSWKISFKNNQWLCYDGTLEHAYGEFKQDPGYLYYGLLNDSTLTKMSETKWKMLSGYYETNFALLIDENNYLYQKSMTSLPTIDLNKISDTKWKFINIYDNQVVGLDENGYAYVWGCNNLYQLGLTDNTTNQKTPVRISDSKWKSISTYNSTFLIDENDYLYGIGQELYLGIGSSSSTVRYTPIKITDTKVKQLHNKYETIGFIDFDGNLYTFGNGFHNSHSTHSQYTPELFISQTKWNNFCNNMGSSYFLQGIDGYIYSFGENYGGWLGNGTNITQYTPYKYNTKWKNILLCEISVPILIGITYDDQYYYWGNQSSTNFIFNQKLNANQYTPLLINNKTSWINLIHNNLYLTDYFYGLFEETL